MGLKSIGKVVLLDEVVQGLILGLWPFAVFLLPFYFLSIYCTIKANRA